MHYAARRPDHLPPVRFANCLVPETDYKPLMSGGHDKSVLGVLRGDFDMALNGLEAAAAFGLTLASVN